MRGEAIQHDSLSSLLADGDKWIEVVYGEEKIFFVRLEQQRQDKMYRNDFMIFLRENT